MTSADDSSPLRFAFTMARLADLPIPVSDRITYHDLTCPGLSLRVGANGTKTFTVLRRMHGRPGRVTLGRFPQITVETARREAMKVMAKIASGQNPALEKHIMRSEMTLGDLFNDYLRLHAKVHKRTWEEDQRRYNAHLMHWKNRPVSAIFTGEIQAWHVRLGKENGHVAANRAHALLRKMYNFAKLRGFTGVNPAVGIPHFREHQRSRFMDATELRYFFSALIEEPDQTVQDFFTFALFTGARRGNVLAMRWDNVDLERGIWRVPGETSKNGDELQIVLVPALVDLLRRRRAQNKAGEWVLPSVTGGEGHFIEPKFAWARILQRAERRALCEMIAARDPSGVSAHHLYDSLEREIDVRRGQAFARKRPGAGDIVGEVMESLRDKARALGIEPAAAGMRNLRIHDLRRTLGSWQAAQGASLSVIGHSLGHRQVSTTAIYARLNLGPVRESVERATSAMLSCSGLLGDSQAVPPLIAEEDDPPPFLSQQA